MKSFFRVSGLADSRSEALYGVGGGTRMNFQDEMKQIFLRVAAGEVEPKEWEAWWNSNKVKLEEALNRGDRGRMMPALWNASYYWMAKT